MSGCVCGRINNVQYIKEIQDYREILLLKNESYFLSTNHTNFFSGKFLLGFLFLLQRAPNKTTLSRPDNENNENLTQKKFPAIQYCIEIFDC